MHIWGGVQEQQLQRCYCPQNPSVHCVHCTQMLLWNLHSCNTKTKSDTLITWFKTNLQSGKKKVHFLMALQGCFTFCSLKECGPPHCYCVNTLVWLQCELHASTSTDDCSLCGLRDGLKFWFEGHRIPRMPFALLTVHLQTLESFRKASNLAEGCKQIAK